jgi:hypothetical protein
MTTGREPVTERPPGRKTRPTLDILGDPEHVTTDQAARLLGIRPGLIRQWASRRKIQPVGRAHGRPVYRFADVLHYWRETRRNAAA